MTTDFWHKNVSFYELRQVMWQTDFEFIYVLNKSRTISQNCRNMDFINKNCFKTLPMDNILPYLFYTNVKTIGCNKGIFEKTPSETFTSFSQDIHFDTCLFHFRLLMIPSWTTRLHHELLVKKYMLVELCARSYINSNGFVNGANRPFQDYT